MSSIILVLFTTIVLVVGFRLSKLRIEDLVDSRLHIALRFLASECGFEFAFHPGHDLLPVAWIEILDIVQRLARHPYGLVPIPLLTETSLG